MVTIINFLIVVIFIVSIFFMSCLGAKQFIKKIIETWRKLCCDGEKNNDEIKLYLSKCNLCKREFIFTSKSNVKMNKIVRDGQTITLCSDCYEKLFNNNCEKKEVVVDEPLKELFGKIKSD